MGYENEAFWLADVRAVRNFRIRTSQAKTTRKRAKTFRKRENTDKGENKSFTKH